MGMSSKALRGGIVLVACAGIGAAASGQAAAQGPPKPEPSPSRAAVRPEASPGAQAPQPAYTYTAPSSAVSSLPSSTTPTYVRPSAHATRSQSHVRTVVRRHARLSKADPPEVPLRPVRSLASWAVRGEFLSASARDLGSSSSGQSLLLLLVGLGLVMLVVGETTFLRRAARAPRPRDAAEEPLPIRRVQLRR